jgi:hypothetical protein
VGEQAAMRKKAAETSAVVTKLIFFIILRFIVYISGSTPYKREKTNGAY